jgi:hypothetical protein
VAKKSKGSRPCFLLLGRAVISKAFEVPLFDFSEERREEFEGLKGIILSLPGEIVDSILPFCPTMNQNHLWPTCEVRYLRGTQWLVK